MNSLKARYESPGSDRFAALLTRAIGLLAVAGPQAWPLRLVTGGSVGARFLRALLPALLGLTVAAAWIAMALRQLGVDPILARTIEWLVFSVPVASVTVVVARRIGCDLDRDKAGSHSGEDGVRLCCEKLPVPPHSTDGDARLVESGSDTTEGCQAQTAIAEARTHAEAAGKARDRLLAIVSRELRTPLTPVLVTLAALQDDPQVPAALRTELAIMRRQIELEAKLIDGLLDLTRMTRGKLQLKPELVDTHVLVDGAFASAAQEADVFHPTAKWDLQATEHFVWADPIRLQQVCWNIIRNALQYTPDSGTIHIRSRNLADGTLELEFADTGAGIDPAFLPRVFDDFERGHHAGLCRSGGLGLGMAIARTLIEQLGGSIQAASEGLGKGAVFTIRLQAVEQARKELPAEPPASAGARGMAVLSPHILLVEDDAETADALVCTLQCMGYRVSTATTVEESLAAGQRERFDLLLCDIGLPDGSGLDVMRWFGRRQSIPGIALSGYATPGYLQRSRDVGFGMHLIKPIAAGALRAAIKEVDGALATRARARTPVLGLQYAAERPLTTEKLSHEGC